MVTALGSGVRGQGSGVRGEAGGEKIERAVTLVML
jgi:hypothetical protein